MELCAAGDTIKELSHKPEHILNVRVFMENVHFIFRYYSNSKIDDSVFKKKKKSKSIFPYVSFVNVAIVRSFV